MKKSDYNDDIAYKNFLQELGVKLREINDIAQQHGIFLADRETVSCTQCGLIEDVAFSGKLFTYYKHDPEFKETGLQFIELDNNNERLKCPACNAEVSAPQENAFD